MAAVTKPISRSVPVQSPSSGRYVHGTRNTLPMLTRDARRYSGAMRRAPAQTSATEGSAGRRMAHSMPRVRWKPVSCVSTSSGAV